MAGNFEGIRTRNFGIEIEMTGLTRCQAAKAIAKVLGGTAHHEGGSYDEYFFGIPKGNKLEVYLLTSPEDLYEYLAEESEGFCLIAKEAPIPTEVGGSEVVTVEQKK